MVEQCEDRNFSLRKIRCFPVDLEEAVEIVIEKKLNVSCKLQAK